MSQTLNIDNFSSINVLEETTLSLACIAGITELTVTSAQNFAGGDIVLLGRKGSETAEIDSLASTTLPHTLTLGTATALAHSKFETITKLYGNQISLYRASNVDGTPPINSSYTPLATFDIDYDQMYTSYLDSTGGSDYWYKYVYYNSTTGLTTTLSESQGTRGGSIGVYASLDSIRQEAGMNSSRYITDATIAQKRAVAQALINATLTGTYVIPFEAPIDPLIEECTRVLAAGYLLLENFGAISASNTNNGQAKIDSITGVKGLLTRINTRDIKLVNAIGVSNVTASSGTFEGFPNADTATADTSVGGGARMFRVGDRY